MVMFDAKTYFLSKIHSNSGRTVQRTTHFVCTSFEPNETEDFGEALDVPAIIIWELFTFRRLREFH